MIENNSNSLSSAATEMLLWSPDKAVLKKNVFLKIFLGLLGSSLCQPRAGRCICIFSEMQVVIKTRVSNFVVRFHYDL